MALPTRRATAPVPQADQSEQAHASIRALPRRATAPNDLGSNGNRRRYILFKTQSSPFGSPQSSSTPLQLRDVASVSPARVKLTHGTVEGFRHLAHSIVSRTLAHECEYDRLGRPEQAESEWKVLKKQNHLQLYKRRALRVCPQADHHRLGSSLEKPPAVACVGSVDGTIEDILYGVHAKTRSEMGATMTFIGRPSHDCDVLAVLESGTDKDPFRQLSIKYLLAEICGDTRVVNNRDVCALESMGFGHDSSGKRYGYHLLRSIDVPECSPLPEDSGVVRANITMCCIYRQVQGTVQVYGKAMTDLGGSLPSFMAYEAASDLLLSNVEAVTSAKAKRLTFLALQNLRSRQEAKEPEDTVSLLTSELRRSSSLCTKPQSSKGLSPTASTLIKDADSIPTSQKTSSRACSVCGKKPMMARLVHSSHRNCGVCDQCVCSKCSIKQNLYARLEPVAVACCKACLLTAKRLKVDPRDPFPMFGYRAL
uniref:FYVE-type domain-containing protein n=1 Tax=Peronospora matthiolae TaxID=2874970 RepID=A0AAV1UTM8_9STRA